MENEVEISTGKVKVREILGIEADEIDFNNSKEAIKKQIIISTGMNEEGYNKLSWHDRTLIIQAINKINRLDDFREPVRT